MSSNNIIYRTGHYKIVVSYWMIFLKYYRRYYRWQILFFDWLSRDSINNKKTIFLFSLYTTTFWYIYIWFKNDKNKQDSWSKFVNFFCRDWTSKMIERNKKNSQIMIETTHTHTKKLYSQFLCRRRKNK